MAILINFKKSVLTLIVIFLLLASASSSANEAQCEQIDKILAASTEGYAQLVDLNKFNLKESPFSQAGQDNVESLLKLPSAEKCQITWVPGRDKFTYLCDWKNKDKVESTANMKVIGDILEKCLTKANVKYDRVNPKSDGNLSFITFYFERASKLKVVLMKFGSSIKSSFEFSGNQQVKPSTLASTNGKFDPDAQWPVSPTVAEDLAKKAQEEKDRIAREEQRKQQIALAEKQKAEQKAREQQKLEDEKKLKEQLAQQALAVKKEEATQSASENNAGILAAAAKALPPVVSPDVTPKVEEAKVQEGKVEEAKVETVAALEKEPKEQQQALADPAEGLTRCWYFASYATAYKEDNSSDSKSYNAALISNIRFIDVEFNTQVEQDLQLKLSQLAEENWETYKPAPTYFYYNSQPFGHINCDADAKDRMERIHKSMFLADWVKEFDVKLN